ncbi:MAG: hypothetical protein HOL51_00270 [Gemmatimonadetes bacterium]|jgi:parvulin-like peptidyl-prolyl isomerase|nr:hypothetical protein [Gemmatimonadota bacterium]MBT5324529.1 hypothetical protein [Gemmatimonadota bacterium]MBT5448408.1 hypothetical protein [Gemmatimonadota bacterium]MBT5803281.1 hypothetical protein [Gemmatimonadota bacterium]MBT6621896.1 hypothetical protein [Gemmatimonadota bacterium]
MLGKMALVGLVLLSMWWGGCGSGSEADGDVVARIDEKEITLEALRQFRAEATASYRDPEEGLKAWRFYLQTMIDMELLLAEAREQQLDQAMEFSRKLEDERRKKLVDLYTTRTIVKEVDRTVDGMRENFAESKWNKMLRLAHIRTESEAEAEKAMRDLEQGKPFEGVARERSVVPTTAERGGVLEPWYGRGNLEEMGLTLEIGEQLFALEIGAFSQPFPVGDYYEIFKVLSEGPAPDHYRASFLRGSYWKEFRVQWDKMVDRLQDQLEPRVDGDVVKVLVERMAGAGRGGMLLSPEDQEVALVRFKGGQVTVMDFAETYNAYWFIRSVSFDSSGISEFIHRDLLPRTLVYQAALQEGLDQDSTIVAWLTAKEESLLLEALRETQVVQRVEVEDAAVKAYYDDNPQLFMQMEEFQVTEILVATRAEAEKLVQRVRGGEDMEQLAAGHTIRSDAEGGHYHMHNHPSERRVFGALYDSVAVAQIGALNGPVKLDAGYSVFKVLERIPAHPTPFAQAASRAKWWVQKQQEKALFDALFVRLREKYAAQIVVFEERLNALAAE